MDINTLIKILPPTAIGPAIIGSATVAPAIIGPATVGPAMKVNPKTEEEEEEKEEKVFVLDEELGDYFELYQAEAHSAFAQLLAGESVIERRAAIDIGSG